MKICLNRGTAGRDLPLDQFVALSAKTGFAGADVDLNYGVEKGAAALRELYASHRQAFGGWGPYDWRNEEQKLNEGMANFHASAKIARELGIDSCATWIMPSSERPFVENFQFHTARLKVIANVLAENGLRLGLEFVAPYHLRRKFSHEFIFTPGLMLELADAVGPNVGLLVDAFHCHASGTPMEEIAKLPKEKIVLCHFNDAPKVALHLIEDGHRLLPGEGVIDLAGFFAALKTAGYDGPVSLEIFNAELRAMSAEDAANKACAAAKKVLTTAGVV